ncbi:unnamed protein product [Orchesella dallaii]|uniref:PH domain-containing protein n=1 Tax=Orchesella dallaii TaxID=48710 RepID=A0ABP1Q468_9HEXA
MGRGREQELPPASSLREKATKVGHLKKLSGKGILTSGTWRERYCLLVKTKLYFYENEKSEGTEKSCGFVNLEYFDTCTEATTRMARKTTNVFVIGSTEKGFFESHSGRHYFAADTVTEMKEWVNAINSAMNHIRGKEKRTRDGSLTPAPGLTKKDSLNSKSKSKEEETGGTLPRSGDRLDHVTKSRVKGPQGRRLPRKSNLGRSSGISDSRPDTVDSLVDSDEDVRDSRGRATSLSALEASSVTHPNTKSNSSNGSGSEENKLGRADTWSNASADLADMIDSQDMDLVYKYSSSDDSDEENRIPLSKSGKGRLTRSPNLGPSSYIQNRGSGRGSYRGSTPLRNSSVTPPPCVIRKFRREQNAASNGNGTLTNNANKKNGKESEGPSSPILPPDENIKPQRTSSGSSLSTLTADTYISNNMTLMGNYSRQNSFSSLQRIGRKNQGGGGSSAGSTSNRTTSSANASPLLGNNSCLQNGYFHRPNGGGGSTSPYGTGSPSGTFDRNAGSAARAFHLERTMHTVNKELEAVSQETKQLDTAVSALKQDVGNVQENLTMIKGYVDKTKDHVTKLQSQVGSIEKQVASVVKEAQIMREQAKKFLEMAESSKATHDNMMEEAEHLINFLRQSASCISTPFHHQHSHPRPPPQFSSSCCSGTSGSHYYGTTNGGGGSPYHGAVTSLRRKSKTPDRTLDSDPEMELLDETQTQMENIIAKHRKSKALLSGSSSSGSGSSNHNHNHAHILASNRNSMIDVGELNINRSMNNNRSPKAGEKA